MDCRNIFNAKIIFASKTSIYNMLWYLQHVLEFIFPSSGFCEFLRTKHNERKEEYKTNVD